MICTKAHSSLQRTKAHYVGDRSSAEEPTCWFTPFESTTIHRGCCRDSSGARHSSHSPKMVGPNPPRIDRDQSQSRARRDLLADAIPRQAAPEEIAARPQASPAVGVGWRVARRLGAHPDRAERSGAVCQKRSKRRRNVSVRSAFSRRLRGNGEIRRNFGRERLCRKCDELRLGVP
jgi:hypothetical protein